MKKEEFNKKYRLDKLQAKKDQGKVIVSWDSKRGNSFLICLHDRRKVPDLDAVIQTVNEAGVEDGDIKEMNSSEPIARPSDTLQVFFIRKTAYEKQVNSKGGYEIQSKYINKDIAYGIQVYACDYDDETLTVYSAEKDECQCYIPIRVTSKITVKDRFLSASKLVSIRVEKMEGYQSGAIYYRIDGLDQDSVPEFPITAECLGRFMYLTVPKKATVYLKVAEEFKGQYKL